MYSVPSNNSVISPSEKPDDAAMSLSSPRLFMESSPERQRPRQAQFRSPWACSILTALTTLLALSFLFSMLRSFATLSRGADGCGVPMMAPSFLKIVDFDTEHTRFASKYNLYLYREQGVDPYDEDNIGVCTILLILNPLRSR